MKGESESFPLFFEVDVYSNLGNKVNKINKTMGPSGSAFLLSDFLDHRFTLLSKEDYINAFSNELKNVLAKPKLCDLVEAFFELESHHHLAESRVGFEIKEIHFDDFYKNVSPILLKSLIDLKKDFAENKIEKIEQQLLESIRISIEDEFDSFLTKEIH